MANSATKTASTSTVTAVKGHLVTKSSALAATGSCKLESQFITAQNMASHYKRVINAKPSIDTLPPKSMVKSQKARDRAKREILNMSTSSAKPLSRTKSVDSLRNSQSDTQQTTYAKQSAFTPRVVKSARGYVEIETKPRALPDRDKLNRSMSNLMSNFTLNSKQRVSTYRPGSTNERSESSNRNLITSRSLQSNNSSALLFNAQNSNDDFNKTKTLHPALKAMSKFASNRNYDVLDNHADRFKMPDKEFKPRIKNTSSESHLGKNSSCYQAPRRRRKKQLQEQQIQSKSNDSINKRSLNNSNIFLRDEEVEGEREEDEEETKTNRSSIIDEDLNDPNDFKATKPAKKLIRDDLASKKSLIENENKTAAEKEEQLKYLEFIKEVTNDIIARGISSNRVINNCFENHIKKNKDVLNESKMRELLVTLRKDIGIKDEQEEANDLETKEHYHQTINKALNINKTQDLNTSGGSEYLTLKKFGWSNDETNKNKQQQNETIIVNNSNNNKSILRKKSDESVTGSPQSRNSSRRGSNKSQDSLSSNKNIQVLNNSKTLATKTENKENSNPHIELKQSNKTPSDSSRKNSNSSITSIKQKNVQNKNHDLNVTHSVETTKHNNHINDEEDDDDDVFSGNYDTPVKNANKQYHEPTNSKTKIVRSENSDIQDIQFDDNYGSEQDIDDDDDENDDDEDFDKLMKTKKVNNIRKKSNESNHSLSSGDYKHGSKQTPKPVPRKLNQSNTKEISDDDDDEF